MLVCLGGCDPGSHFTISNPCAVELDAAVFLDPDDVPSLTSHRKLVRVPPGGTADDADLGAPRDSIALVLREGRSQKVFEMPFSEEVAIPEDACDGIE